MAADGPRLVGPTVTDPRIAEAVAGAIATDTGVEPVIDSRGGYLRVQTPMRARMTQASLEDELGMDMPLANFEKYMPSFAGRIKVGDDEIVWYLEEQS